MNGFERELRTRILSVTSHAMLMGIHGTIDDWREVQQVVEREPGVIAAAPYIEAQALVANKKTRERRDGAGRASGGRSANHHHRSASDGRCRSRNLKDGAYNVILGVNLAKELRVGGRRRRRHHRPGGHADAQRRRAAHAPIPRDRHAAVRHVRVRQHDGDRAHAGCRAALQARRRRDGCAHDVAGSEPLHLHAPWPDAISWARTSSTERTGPARTANFFRAIQTTKSMMFIILLMIVAVAAFNIVSTLVMIVKEKQSDIAILRTIGVGPKNVLAMFFVQGVLIGLAGTAHWCRAGHSAFAQHPDPSSQASSTRSACSSWMPVSIT